MKDLGVLHIMLSDHKLKIYIAHLVQFFIIYFISANLGKCHVTLKRIPRKAVHNPAINPIFFKFLMPMYNVATASKTEHHT